MRNEEREAAAKKAAQVIRQKLNIPKNVAPIGLVLGTGWGSVLAVKDSRGIAFSQIPGFESLKALEGHARQVVFGYLEDKPVIFLRGRVHMNEAPSDPSLARMVRLQIEMLLRLGVKTLIVTSAVGSLSSALPVGSIGIVNGFVTIYAPEMPLWGGEFCSPEDTLDPALRQIALQERGELLAAEVGHVMVRGPFFEGRRYDKPLLAKSGAGVVGMSVLPEACIAALYSDARILALCFVTNNALEKHSHEENLARAKAASGLLGGYLSRLIARIS